jgi:hypothetical protein
MRKLVLPAAVILMLVGVGSTIKVLTNARPVATTTSPIPTISIEEVNRQVDAKSLPTREVREPF